MITTVSTTDGLLAALKAANAGDTILLASGTYSAVSLTGLNFAGTVTVQSADSAHQAVISTLNLSYSSGLAFNHIEFTSGGATAVTVNGSQNVSFDATKIDGGAVAGGNGMMIRDSSGVSVTHSDIGNLGTGINELNSTQLTISNNVFHDIQNGDIRGSGDTVETISANQFLNANPTITDHSDVIQLWQDNVANQVTITTDSVPVGNPAALAASARARAHPLVDGACLSTTTLPAASAGARARTTCQ